jgi:hypothetical protein
MIRWAVSGVIKEEMLGIPPSSEPVNTQELASSELQHMAKLRSCGNNLMRNSGQRFHTSVFQIQY